MSILDALYSVMLAEVGDSQQAVPDLWKRYLASLGYTQSTVLGQMQAFAEANGLSIVDATNFVASGFTPAGPATVPGAPTIGTATAGNAQATVTFTPPASNGGSTITSYTATSSPGGITKTGAGSPLTVTGLTNGTPYTFTVVATNDIGDSAPSAASNSVTPSTSNLIVNGTFTTDTDWTKNTGWAITGGQAVKTAGNGGNIYQGFAFEAATYEVTFTVVSTNGNVNCRFINGSGANVVGTNRGSPGTYTEQLVAVDHTNFAINAGSTIDAVIDDVSMIKIS